MVDHSEFPYGVEYEPGLLTPLGLVGWAVASALLLLLILRARDGGRARGGDAVLQDIHKIVLAAARYALKQDEFGVLKGADVLMRVVRVYLGGVLMAGSALGKQVKALETAMGKEDDKDKKKDDKHGHGGHGGHDDHGHGGQGGHAAPHAGPGAAAHTVQGHSITVNVGGDSNGHGDHDAHGDEDKPKTMEEQLAALRKAVREFEAWWSDKPARMAELRAAQDDLTRKKPVDATLMALFEEKK
ncbi:MAG: hypothetical protein ACOY4K_15295 [Pseudomonadota bacterium]